MNKAKYLKEMIEKLELQAYSVELSLEFMRNQQIKYPTAAIGLGTQIKLKTNELKATNEYIEFLRGKK